MLFKANVPQLERLAKNFYEITKTLITIYDEKQNVICAYPEHLCGFCTEVRKNPVLSKKCLQCDQSAFSMCNKKTNCRIAEITPRDTAVLLAHLHSWWFSF